MSRIFKVPNPSYPDRHQDLAEYLRKASRIIGDQTLRSVLGEFPYLPLAIHGPNEYSLTGRMQFLDYFSARQFFMQHQSTDGQGRPPTKLAKILANQPQRQFRILLEDGSEHVRQKRRNHEARAVKLFQQANYWSRIAGSFQLNIEKGAVRVLADDVFTGRQFQIGKGAPVNPLSLVQRVMTHDAACIFGVTQVEFEAVTAMLERDIERR